MVQSKADVFDVAKYILTKQGMMSTWKLQKLCYYAQAWSLAWTGENPFFRRILKHGQTSLYALICFIPAVIYSWCLLTICQLVILTT